MKLDLIEMDENGKLIVENAEDMTVNKSECPLSYEIYKIWSQYSTKNLILDNGQMLCLKCDEKILFRVSDYMKKTLTEFIQTEKNLNECTIIKNNYIENINKKNNSSKYTKLIIDSIINMDRVYKYAWNISKLLNDNITSYKKFVSWQQGKINIENKTKECWDFIYSIRNKIEHPDDLNTTMFERKKNEIQIPKIIVNNSEYDLMQLGENAKHCAFMLYKSIVAAAFLYSKYVVCFTDETRQILYKA